MPGWRRGRLLIAVLSGVTLCACETPKVKVDKMDVNPEWSKEEVAEELGHGDGHAVKEAFEREKISPEAPQARGTTQLKSGEPIWLQSGKSRVIELPAAVKRVSIGNPSLAGVVVLGPRTLMINAKELPKTRTTSARGGTFRSGIITANTLTPEPHYSETTFTVWHDKQATPDVHTLFVADFLDQQVLLEVMVAEINRTAIETHGIDFRSAADSFLAAYFMGGGVGPAPIERLTVPPQSNQPVLPLGQAADAPTFAFMLPKEDITGFILALQREGLATVLAQPKLIAMSGQNAVFQVGGEIPVVTATGFATDIEFKPFGTIVNFVPRVSEEGDIMLTVTPEVSQADFNSLVQGIPSFRTRRASTSMRMRSGQTLVIGGLLQRTMTEEQGGLPYLKDIPYLGYVFRRSTYNDEVTEMLVVVTPHLVSPLPPGTELALPTDRPPLTNEEIRTRPHPAEATRPRLPWVP